MKRLRSWLDRRRGIVFRTKTGKLMRDADVQALADEAERGYDVSEFTPVSEERAREIRGQR